VRVTHTGEPVKLDEYLAEIRSCAPVLGEAISLRDFQELQTEVDAAALAGPLWFTVSAHARDLNGSLIEELVATADAWPGDEFEPDGRIKRQAVVDVVMLGGAVQDVPEDAMAYPGRDAMWLITFLVATSDASELESLRTVVRQTHARVKPHLDMKTSWLNMYVDPQTGTLADVYGDEKFEKLRALKRRWDPDNFFSHNANITP
jgi:hypothetical protein